MGGAGAAGSRRWRAGLRSLTSETPDNEGLTRGKGCSPGKPFPDEHDGADAAALSDWISRQPWSDGRVGVYVGSYDGFTQWAAAKHMPKALTAPMPQAWLYGLGKLEALGV